MIKINNLAISNIINFSNSSVQSPIANPSRAGDNIISLQNNSCSSLFTFLKNGWKSLVAYFQKLCGCPNKPAAIPGQTPTPITPPIPIPPVIIAPPRPEDNLNDIPGMDLETVNRHIEEQRARNQQYTANLERINRGEVRNHPLVHAEIAVLALGEQRLQTLLARRAILNVEDPQDQVLPEYVISNILRMDLERVEREIATQRERLDTHRAEIRRIDADLLDLFIPNPQRRQLEILIERGTYRLGLLEARRDTIQEPHGEAEDRGAVQQMDLETVTREIATEQERIRRIDHDFQTTNAANDEEFLHTYEILERACARHRLLLERRKVLRIELSNAMDRDALEREILHLEVELRQNIQQDGIFEHEMSIDLQESEQAYLGALRMRLARLLRD